MTSFLIKDLVNNTQMEIEKLNEIEEQNLINDAINSKQVKEAKRIAQNINIQNIKNLRNQVKKLNETKNSLKNLIKTIDEEEKKIGKQIKVMQARIDSYNQKENKN